MATQNIDLNSLRCLLGQLCYQIDHLIQSGHEASTVPNPQMSNRDANRLNEIEQMVQKLCKQQFLIMQMYARQQTQIQQCQNSVESLEAEIPDLRYLVDRNQELECWADPYSADGDAICNSRNID